LTKIETLIHKFVEDIRQAVLEDASAAVFSRLGLSAAPPARPKAYLASKPAHRKLAHPNTLVSAIVKKPGQTITQLSAALGVSVAALSPAVKRLMAENVVRAEGVRRGTRYYPVK